MKPKNEKTAAACLVVLGLAFLAAAGELAGESYFAVETIEKDVAVTAVAPAEIPEGQTWRLTIFFAERNAQDPHYLESMLARREDLPGLAAEMKTVFLFVKPKTGETRPAVRAAEIARAEVLRKYLLDPDRVTAVGHRGGSEAAFRFFVTKTDETTSLVLLEPTLTPAPQEPRAPRDSRAALVTYAANNPSAGDAAQHRLVERSSRADVTLLEAPSPKAVPATHLALFAGYADAAYILREEKAAPARVPIQGPRRVERLQSLLKARDVAQGGVGLVPVVLSKAAGPTVERNSRFVYELETRTQRLKTLAEEVARKVDRTLTAAKTQADARLQAIRNAKTSPERKRHLLESFIEENFPWPDLVKAAREAIEAAEEKKDAD